MDAVACLEADDDLALLEALESVESKYTAQQPANAAFAAVPDSCAADLDDDDAFLCEAMDAFEKAAQDRSLSSEKSAVRGSGLSRHPAYSATVETSCRVPASSMPSLTSSEAVSTLLDSGSTPAICGSATAKQTVASVVAPLVLKQAPKAPTRETAVEAAKPQAKERPRLVPLAGTEVDEEAVRTWVYPINKPTREYQLALVKKALFNNSIVCLPTGLGKTFIAAVVMYNYYRWFPNGLVLFLAPTRPLVAQQVHSCRSVVGLPHSDIEEVTGQMKAEIRRKVWGSRRVVFATPQVVINDLNNDLIDKEKICCIVIDEAHKATGNHAYCQVVNNLHEAWKRASEKYYREGRGDVFSAGPLERCYRTREKAANRSMAGYGGGAFRLLALTATPGRAFQDIQTIVTNLLAAKVLVRTDSDPDVRQYSHGRNVETIKICFSPSIADLRNGLLRLLAIPINRLFSEGLLYDRDVERLSLAALLESRKKYRVELTEARKDQSGARLPNKFTTDGRTGMELCFANAMFLAKALQHLERHGLRTCQRFCLGRGETGNEGMQAIIQRSLEFRDWLGRLTALIESGEEHPKLQMLCYILQDFLKKAQKKQEASGDAAMHTDARESDATICTEVLPAMSPSPSKKLSSKIIIFTEFRDCVEEILSVLERYQPLVRASGFVGQSSSSRKGTNSKGLNQAEQASVLGRFRAGIINTLVATCVGEEGLDIGEVDLIISYDALTSPVRMVQRMGRTGRARTGKVNVFVSEGAEERQSKRCNEKTEAMFRMLKNEKIMQKIEYFQHCGNFLGWSERPILTKRVLTQEHDEDRRTESSVSADQKRSVEQRIASELLEIKRRRILERYGENIGSEGRINLREGMKRWSDLLSFRVSNSRRSRLVAHISRFVQNSREDLQEYTHESDPTWELSGSVINADKASQVTREIENKRQRRRKVSVKKVTRKTPPKGESESLVSRYEDDKVDEQHAFHNATQDMPVPTEDPQHKAEKIVDADIICEGEEEKETNGTDKEEDEEGEEGFFDIGLKGSYPISQGGLLPPTSESPVIPSPPSFDGRDFCLTPVTEPIRATSELEQTSQRSGGPDTGEQRREQFCSPIKPVVLSPSDKPSPFRVPQLPSTVKKKEGLSADRMQCSQNDHGIGPIAVSPSDESSPSPSQMKLTRLQRRARLQVPISHSLSASDSEGSQVIKKRRVVKKRLADELTGKDCGKQRATANKLQRKNQKAKDNLTMGLPARGHAVNVDVLSDEEDADFLPLASHCRPCRPCLEQKTSGPTVTVSRKLTRRFIAVEAEHDSDDDESLGYSDEEGEDGDLDGFVVRTQDMEEEEEEEEGEWSDQEAMERDDKAVYLQSLCSQVAPMLGFSERRPKR